MRGSTSARALWSLVPGAWSLSASPSPQSPDPLPLSLFSPPTVYYSTRLDWSRDPGKTGSVPSTKTPNLVAAREFPRSPETHT